MAADDRWAARAGWHLTAERVAKNPEGLDLPALLDRIESEMAGAAPEVQWTMNNTLANIGIHAPKLRKRAIAIGEKLGIYRDYIRELLVRGAPLIGAAAGYGVYLAARDAPDERVARSTRC